MKMLTFIAVVTVGVANLVDLLLALSAKRQLGSRSAAFPKGDLFNALMTGAYWKYIGRQAQAQSDDRLRRYLDYHRILFIVSSGGVGLLLISVLIDVWA